MSKLAKAHGKIIKSSFTVPKWAKNRHVQTIWPRFIQKRMPLSYQMERLTLPDNDFVDVAWGPKPEEVSGIVVLFHGFPLDLFKYKVVNLSCQGEFLPNYIY